MKNKQQNLEQIKYNLSTLSWNCPKCKEVKNCTKKSENKNTDRYCLAIISAAILNKKIFKIPF